MKTLLYVLSTPKSGTTQLSRALQRIGICAHHELVDIKSLYPKWMKKRFTPNPLLDIESAKRLWENVLLKYLQGEGYFADISHYLSILYPMIDNMDIETRSIHLTRNFLPHRLMSWKLFANPGRRTDDNTEHIYKDLEWVYWSGSQECYPAELSWCSNIKWEDWVSMSQFERLCWYFKLHSEYFLLGKRKIFHVEDFNIKYLEILEILYPETNDEQKDKFKKALFYEPLLPEKADPPYTLEITDEQKEIYEKICGPTLKKLGYE